VQFSKLSAFTLESVDKHFDFFFGTDQTFDSANTGGIFLTDLNSKLDGCHIPFCDPVKAVNVMQKISFDLLYGSCMQLLLFNHLESPI